MLTVNQVKQRSGMRSKGVLIDVPLGSSVEEQMWEMMVREVEQESKELQNSVSKRFLNPDPVAWINEHFRIPETEDHRMPLDEYQIACIRRIFQKNEDNLWDYSIVVWSDIKKSAKSTIAAAVALWFAFQLEWGSIKIVANDLKQADSRVSFYIRRSIELNPELSEVCHVVPSGYHITLPNHTVIESIAVDPKGEAGGNDDAVFFSELWGANNKASQKLWTELTLPPLKFGKSFRWVETYAGFSGEAETLENLYSQGVKEGERLDFSGQFEPELEVFENKTARMFCLWNTIPRRSWQTEEYYGQESAILKPNEFRRVHKNEWVTSESVFVPIEWWNACEDKNMPDFSANDPMILAVDAGVSNDYFGIIGVSGYDDGENYGVRYTKVWKPVKIGVEIDYGKAEEEIRRLIDNFNIIEINYDPYQLVDMSQRLRRDLVVRMRKFQQESERTLADTLLYQKIMKKTVHHRGEEELTEHIKNANSTAVSKERIRLIKRSQLLKIDLAVCLSMALSRAVYWRL